jgi:hypothetical protein
MKMTPTLQEFANQAWQFAQQEVPFTDNGGLIEHADRREVEMAKYAELIVKACAKASEEMISVSGRVYTIKMDPLTMMDYIENKE